MKNKSIKLMTALGVVSVVGMGSALADGMSHGDHGHHTADMGGHMRMDHMGPNYGAVFSARGSETKQITIGGFMEFGYQNVWGEFKGNVKNTAPHYNNFLMNHLRLLVNAEIGGGWSALANIDFAKTAENNVNRFTAFNIQNLGFVSELPNAAPARHECTCSDPVSLDKAYIQKVFCDHKLRFGYQKVDFGAEEVTTDPSLKTISRGTTTNYFTNFGTNGFAGRHLGIFLSGDFPVMCDHMLHYSAALVNGYQGYCRNSGRISPDFASISHSNNELGVFGGLAYAFMLCDIDMTVGLNGGYQPEGNSEATGNTKEAWALNPYLLGQFGNFSLMAEFFYGTLDSGTMTTTNDAHPWGLTLVPSLMLNDQWELVGRFAYLDTDESGTTMVKAFGCVPGSNTVGADGVTGQSNGQIRDFASQVNYNKVYSWYLGVNYYLMNKAVKASVGYDGARFKDSWGAADGTAQAAYKGPHANASAFRASIQLLF